MNEKGIEDENKREFIRGMSNYANSVAFIKVGTGNEFCIFQDKNLNRKSLEKALQ